MGYHSIYDYGRDSVVKKMQEIGLNITSNEQVSGLLLYLRQWMNLSRQRYVLVGKSFQY